MRMWVIAVIALAASTGTSRAQDAAAGEQVFRRMCSPCHDVGEEAKVKLGPPQNGLDGRKAGTMEGFNYSPANKNSGITWSDETFAKYIRAPMQEMPGTQHGVRRHQEREGHRGPLGLSQVIRARRKEKMNRVSDGRAGRASVRFRSSHALAARSDANFGIDGH